MIGIYFILFFILFSFVYLFILSYFHLFIYLFIYSFIYLSIYLFIYLLIIIIFFFFKSCYLGYFRCTVREATVTILVSTVEPISMISAIVRVVSLSPTEMSEITRLKIRSSDSRYLNNQLNLELNCPLDIKKNLTCNKKF